MKDKDLYLLVISIILIICPFLINIYTILKLIILIVGIILLDIFLVKKTKLNLFPNYNHYLFL